MSANEHACVASSQTAAPVTGPAERGHAPAAPPSPCQANGNRTAGFHSKFQGLGTSVARAAAARQQPRSSHTLPWQLQCRAAPAPIAITCVTAGRPDILTSSFDRVPSHAHGSTCTQLLGPGHQPPIHRGCYQAAWRPQRHGRRLATNACTHMWDLHGGRTHSGELSQIATRTAPGGGMQRVSMSPFQAETWVPRAAAALGRVARSAGQPCSYVRRRSGVMSPRRPAAAGEAPSDAGGVARGASRTELPGVRWP